MASIIVNTGHEPWLPDIFKPHVGPRLFHSSTFSTSWKQVAGQLRKVAIVGAGQNAGEILLHLAGNEPQLELHSLVRNSGFRLYDLGHFSNQAYWPDETEYFYGLEPAGRAAVFAEQYRTNYACVDPDVSTGLYRTWYQDMVLGQKRLIMHKRTEIGAVEPNGDGWRLHLSDIHTGATSTLDVDAVIACTGFREPRLPRVLAGFAPLLRYDEEQRLRVTRRYSLELSEACDVAVYLNGMTEWRHGIANATSFSLIAIRAGEIVADIVERRSRRSTRTSERRDEKEIARA